MALSDDESMLFTKVHEASMPSVQDEVCAGLPVMALTATATTKVIEDILKSLKIQQCRQFQVTSQLHDFASTRAHSLCNDMQSAHACSCCFLQASVGGDLHCVLLHTKMSNCRQG